MSNKKLNPSSSSRNINQSPESSNEDFSYRFSAQSRSRSTPHRVRFAEKPLCPESDPEDSIIVRDQIQKRMMSGEQPQPILKDTEYVPPKPSYFRLLKRRLIRKTRKNTHKIIGISLFLFFAFILFQLMFRWGNSKTQIQRQRRPNVYQTNNFIHNYDQAQKSPLFVGFNVESNLDKGNSEFLNNNGDDSHLFNISGAILASFMTTLIGIALYLLVL